jgi:biopolymer transport protein ExbD
MSKPKNSIIEDVAPNLIPMVDIMFLLLLFFMLGADMGHRELEEVILPKADAATKDPPEKTQDEGRLTINVYHRYANEVLCDAYARRTVCREPGHWRIGIRGNDYADFARLGERLKQEAAKFPDPEIKGASNRRVMIRADASAPFSLVQGTLNASAFAGIRRIECGAATPPKAAPVAGMKKV